jgi:TatD DNase family protein
MLGRFTNNPPDCQPIEHLKAQEQFKDAFGSKFEGCISVCCDPPTWTKTWYEWLIRENNVWLTYGCHPAKAALFDESAETTLQMLLSFPKVVALGEIGLDETYYERQGATQEVQIDAFKRQVEIARRMNKSLVIHLL